MKIIGNLLPRYTLYALFVFCYFGFIIIPQWFRPLSLQFIVWIIALPIVLSTLLVRGIRSGISLYRNKMQKAQPNPQHKFFVLFASLSLIWFLASITLAKETHFAYNHIKFDSALWKSNDSQSGDSFNLSLRQRMLDDLSRNVLPQSTKSEVESLLGMPDDTWVAEGTETFLYFIGFERGLGVDSECLLVIFDAKGSFKEYDTLPICG